MGFLDFLFKKKQPQVEARPAPAAADAGQTRKSRRAIPAGGKSAPPAAPAKPAGDGTRPSSRPAPVAAAADDGDGLVLASAPAPAPAPEKRGSAPITSSRPPEFAGDLGAARPRSGNCRTGDPAMIEFLSRTTPQRAALLTPEQLADVKVHADRDGVAVDMAAVAAGFITEDQLVNALTQECWVPHLKVDKYEIRKKALDTIAKEDAVYFGVFPVDKLGSLLTLAMANPLDTATIDALAGKTGLDIKKVVATRSEIAQGIDKYYGGKVQAKDGSISFTQDIEPKSVTAMMAKVASASERVPAELNIAPAPAPAPRPSVKPDLDITPEIQDIDDLLAGDETIAPAIIEPISLKAEAEPEPVIQPPTAFADSEPAFAEPLAPKAPAPEPEPVYGQIELDDTAPVDLPRIKPAPEAAEFQVADVAVAPGGSALERSSPLPAPAPAAKPAAPARPAPVEAARPAAPARPAPVAAAPSARAVDLVPVTEAEFQHAISHGRSHLYEKWVGLQTRNRVINAVPVDRELEPLLAPLFAHAA
jgi:hypothetical protein